MKVFRLVLSLVIVLTSLSSAFSRVGVTGEFSSAARLWQDAIEDDLLQTAVPLVKASASAASTQSLSLDGTGDYVQIPHDPALGLDGASALTIEAWVRRADDSRCETVISKDLQSAYWLGFCSGPIRFFSGGSGTDQDGNTDILTGVWTHIAVVWESGGQRKYYVNGELDYTGSAGASPAANAYSVFIGADPGPDPNAYEFSGNIAEVRLWNVARGQDDIRRTMHVTLDEARPGLVANWRLGDDFDDSIGAHDGVAVGDANLAVTDPAVSLQPARVPVDGTFNTLAATRSGAATAYVPNLDRALLISGSKGGTLSDNVDALDVSTGNVSPLATLPTSLTLASAVHVPSNDTVYVFGGWSSSLGGATDSIYALNPITGALRTLGATVPISTYEAAAVYHAGLDKVYLLGGIGSSGAFTDVSVFDPATETITPTNFGLPFGRYGMAAAYSPASDKIYYFGGIEAGAVNTIFEIALDEDGLNGTLTQLAATLPGSSSRFNAVRDPVTQLIYLLGGDYQDRVLAFDPLTGQLWQTPIEMENWRIRSSAIYSPRSRQALLMGGYNAGSQSNVWRIPLGDGPAISLGRWDFPMPVGAGVAAIDGDETRVLIGTGGDGAWRYEDDGSRYHYTASILGSAGVNDVRYNALNDHSWFATTDAGGQVDVDGSMTVYDSSVLGTDYVEAVYVDPGYLSIDSAPYFGTRDEGLKRKTWQNGWVWTTNFVGETVKAITRRDAGDMWVISNGRLKQLTFDPLAETDYGDYQCDLVAPADLAFGPNGDWWLVSSYQMMRAATAQDHDLPPCLSSGTGALEPGVCRAPAASYNGVCRILAADTPSVGNPWEPSIGTLGTAVDVDSDGRVWVSLGSGWYNTESGGLVAYEVVGATPGKLYTAEYNWLNAPLGGLYVTSSGEDVVSGFTAVGAADERVWGGKYDGRLVTLAQRWQQLDESNDLDQKVIEGIWTVRGRAFMATSDSLHVLMPDGQTWDNRNGVQVWDVMGDSRGRTWVGTDTGIRLYTRDGWDDLSTVEGVCPAYAIYALAEDQAGRVWIGGLQGLTLFDRDRFVFTLTDANSGLPDDKIRALLSDRDDRLWVGTDEGLARLEGSAWTVFSTTHGLPSDAIFDLAQTGAGEIAVSTAGGLAFYDGGSFITETLPLPDANLPLTVDEMGRLWAGSAVRAAGGWQGYYWTNSGLRSSKVSDNAADGAERVWFSHAPDTGVSLRGSTLPSLPDVLPTLTDISPDHGSAGQTITIRGSGFGSRIADLDVTVGHAPVDIISLSDTEITVRLNDHNRSGDVSVSLGGRRTSLIDAFCADPVLTAFSPTGGNDGVTVHVRGSNFDPSAQVSLGGAARVADFTDATHLWLDIRPEDGTGPVQVTNKCGSPHTTSSSVEFRRIALNLETIVLNQGIIGTGLVADRKTMVQHYVSQSVARRGTDRLEIDTIELGFTEAGSAPRTYTIPYGGVVPNLSGPPSGAALADTNMSINAPVRPQITGSILGAEVQVDAVLKRRGQIVAQGSTAAWFRPNYSMRVLLVPIMKNDYVPADVTNLQENVNTGLEHLLDRIMPTGRVEIYWSPLVYTVDSVLMGGENAEIDLGSTLQLYDASHSLDQARRWWNTYQDPDVFIAFGVVDDRALSATSISGQAFWPDMSQIINQLALDTLDLLCDVGNALLQIFSFGFLGSDDGCHLEIPLYVGWARGDATSAGDSTQYSGLYGHEIGHIMGLVKPYAPNGSWIDNFSHSVNDELDNGACDDGGVTFNWDKSLYAQPGVFEPVVDPIGMTQFTPTNDGSANTVRGKAIMSYACTRNNDNVFFEPADVLYIFFEYAASSARNFVEDLTPGGGRIARSTTSVSQANDVPLPLPVSGERLYVSGVITKTGDSGRLQNVEVLDEQAPLDAGYATGYWLVQLDADGGELSRLGVFPVFTTVGSGSSGAGHAVESDSGFFAATMQRQEGVARVELRHDDALLDALEAGGAAPSVSVSSPAGGVYDSGTIHVAWTASDTDGDPLDITVLYSADGALSWTPVAFSSGSGSVEVAVSQLAGSSDARFQVIASDGFNTGSATSAAFTVSDQPPRPYVGSPISASTFLEGDTVMLSGGANDNQDGSVAAEGLHWRSDRDGELGSGAELPVLLSVGTHVLTLEAQNSVGLTATASTTATIRGDYDYDGIGDDEELSDGLNPLTEMDAYSDADGDGLPLITERQRNLDPDNPDSDGDGRSDADEIADGTDPLADDEPLPPDALSASPSDLAFEADLALDTPLPQQVVQVSSRSPATWTLTADVDWLAASAASGQTPAGLTIMVSAYRLDDGLHTAHLTFIGNQPGAGAITPATVTVTVNVTSSLAHFDVNLDGYVNVQDVQEVEERIGSDNSQEDFSYRHDVDRDGDVDANDWQLIWDAVFRFKIYLPIIMR
jgi:hypothetical protein